MIVDPTRVCELLVGLGDVTVLGAVDEPAGPVIVHVETRSGARLVWHKRRWCSPAALNTTSLRSKRSATGRELNSIVAARTERRRAVVLPRHGVPDPSCGTTRLLHVGTPPGTFLDDPSGPPSSGFHPRIRCPRSRVNSTVGCSVMSVSHNWFGSSAVNTRRTRSSCAGGPGLERFELFFLPKLDHQALSRQVFHTVRSHATWPASRTSSVRNR